MFLNKKTRRERLSLKILTIGVIVSLSLGCQSQTKPTPQGSLSTSPTPETIVKVQVAKADYGSLANEASAIGTVAPVEQTTVSANVSAQIQGMGQWKNRAVRKGEVLAILASGDLQAQRLQAEAALKEARLNLESVKKISIPQSLAQLRKSLIDAKAAADNAQTVYDRRKGLYEKGGLSLRELESSELVLVNAKSNLTLIQENLDIQKGAVGPNSVDIALARVEQAADRIKIIDSQASFTEVRAPIDGTVTDQFLFQGDYASQGSKILLIASVDNIVVKARFPDTTAAGIVKGQAVSVFQEIEPDEKIEGKVSLVSRSTDMVNRTVEVWAEVPNDSGSLKIGDAVRMFVGLGGKAEIVIPLSAVTLDSPNSTTGIVDVVDKNSLAKEQRVEVGHQHQGKVQVLTGLSAGDLVVTEGNFGLPDGTKVQIETSKGSAKNGF
jgi:HlyD family secretion protein